MEKNDISWAKNKKTALVLSGGVVKAASWHTGVALALFEMGFQFKNNYNSHSKTPELEISTIVGSSAGAMIGVLLSCGLDPEDIMEANMKSRNSQIKGISYKDLLSLKAPRRKPPSSKIYTPFEGIPFPFRQMLRPLAQFSGFFSTDGIAKYLRKNILDEDSFDSLDADLFIVATQLDHSVKNIFGKYNYPSTNQTILYQTGVPVSQAAAGSMAVPPFYSPYPIKDPYTGEVKYFIDGEIRDTLSTHVAMDNECEIIISSWTHTPYHFHDEIGSLINFGLPAICVQSIYLMIQKKIVASRNYKYSALEAIKIVNDYMVENKFNSRDRKNLVSILEQKLGIKANIKLIDIFPKHHNYELFFSSFFSLNPEVTFNTLKMGYNRTWEVFSEIKI